LISIVIKNLVNNAFKYSESDSSIQIKTVESENNVKLIIVDNGIGIPESEKKKVFEKFFRVGEEKTRKQPGSGLGLYLVKKITEIHKGKIVLSDNKPSGCIFTITLFKNIKLDEVV
jgi:signal transduction histidine kinase